MIRVRRAGGEALIDVTAHVRGDGAYLRERPAGDRTLDGETLRGNRKQGAAGTHLLSALAPRLGLTADPNGSYRLGPSFGMLRENVPVPACLISASQDRGAGERTKKVYR